MPSPNDSAFLLCQRAEPLTRKFLELKKFESIFQKKMGDTDNEMNDIENCMNEADRGSCFILTQNGNNDSVI